MRYGRIFVLFFKKPVGWLGLAFAAMIMFFPNYLFAQAPSITAFNVTPASMNSGQVASLGWTIQHGSGYLLLLSCPSGVKVKNTDGSAFACNAIVSGVSLAGGYNLLITNASGGRRTVSVRLAPKDAGGSEYAAAAETKSIDVSPDPRPIMSFIGPGIATSSVPAVFSWTSQGLDGVNLIRECNDAIRISSSNYSGDNLPCGTPIFTNDLAANGSIALNFTNSSPLPLPLKLTLLPAFVPKNYDATHSREITVSVATDIAPDPEVTVFTASSTIAYSGAPVSVLWQTINAAGVNLKISCQDSITATSSKNHLTPLPCDALAFSSALDPAGTVALTFTNRYGYERPVVVSLLASGKSGRYDAIRAKSITFSVRPRMPESQPPPPRSISVPAISSTSTALGAPIASSTTLPTLPPPMKKIVFSQYLRRGSKTQEVGILQEFLKRDSAIYPEGLVTGYFGPATERAVQRFQAKHGIASGGSPAATGYGAVGPKTRAKLNSVQ